MTTIRHIDLDAASSLSTHRGSGRDLKGRSTYSLKHASENDVVKPSDAVPIQNPEKPSRLKQSSLLQVTLLFAFTFHAELEHGPTWNFHFGAQYERTIVFNPDNVPEIQNPRRKLPLPGGDVRVAALATRAKAKRDEEESDYDPGWILSPPMMVRHVPLAMPNFEFTEHLPRNKKGDPFSESPWVFLMFLGCGT
jgi:hypothetical protein